jgi:hypothetical protein
MRQLQAQLLQPSPIAARKFKKPAPKTSNKNKERNTNEKPSVVIDLDKETTEEVQVQSTISNNDTDDFERPKLARSGSSKGRKGQTTSPEQPSMRRTNSRMKSAIVEDNRMVVDEDEDTEQNYSQLSNSAGLLLLHSSQKSNTNKNNYKDSSKARKNRKELSSDNYPSDTVELSSQDKRNRVDFRNSTSSIFVLHPQMESQLKEAKAVFGDKTVVIDTTAK